METSVPSGCAGGPREGRGRVAAPEPAGPDAVRAAEAPGFASSTVRRCPAARIPACGSARASSTSAPAPPPPSPGPAAGHYSAPARRGPPRGGRHRAPRHSGRTRARAARRDRQELALTCYNWLQRTDIR
ncbi:hypothetical protein GCM10018987_08100 [Streptomyces cremeus]